MAPVKLPRRAPPCSSLSSPEALLAADRWALKAYAGAGINSAISANRVSFAMGLRGPSLVVDTACSSGLVAVDAAASQVLRGGSRRALAAAANMLLAPMVFDAYAAARMLSPAGRCRSFDAGADGYCRAEGVCACLLAAVGSSQGGSEALESSMQCVRPGLRQVGPQRAI